jgi:hypothetical protein
MSSGIEPFYKEFQNIPNTNDKQIDIEKIYNKIINVPTKDKEINLITDIPDSYSLVVMESISDYLLKKYGTSKQDKVFARIMCNPINNFTSRYKQLNPSVNGKRTTEVLSSLSRFVEYVKNRNTIQKLTGAEEK